MQTGDTGKGLGLLNSHGSMTSSFRDEGVGRRGAVRAQPG